MKSLEDRHNHHGENFMPVGIVLWSNEGIELHNDIKTTENLVNLIKGTLGLFCNLIIFPLLMSKNIYCKMISLPKNKNKQKVNKCRSIMNLTILCFEIFFKIKRLNK